jgi:hypothetical protein
MLIQEDSAECWTEILYCKINTSAKWLTEILSCIMNTSVECLTATLCCDVNKSVECWTEIPCCNVKTCVWMLHKYSVLWCWHKRWMLIRDFVLKSCHSWPEICIVYDHRCSKSMYSRAGCLMIGWQFIKMRLTNTVFQRIRSCFISWRKNLYCCLPQSLYSYILSNKGSSLICQYFISSPLAGSAQYFYDLNTYIQWDTSTKRKCLCHSFFSVQHLTVTVSLDKPYIILESCYLMGKNWEKVTQIFIFGVLRCRYLGCRSIKPSSPRGPHPLKA